MPQIEHKPNVHNANAWREFERRCQKPDYKRIGNFMARRIARPLALRITWVLAPIGISAHAMTFISLGVAIAAALVLALGSVWSILAGALLLQLWYLLDHVDGQLARFAQKETLDGAALDYLMHHLVNLMIPLGLGWGLYRQSSVAWWMLAGVASGMSLLAIGLVHDVRYKAITKRLKRVRGELRVIGGGGAKPAAQPPIPREPKRLAMWLARKLCEVHVVMNLLTLVGLVALLFADELLLGGKLLLGGLAVLSLLLAGFELTRGLARASAEREFSAWYAPPADSTLIFEDGWWKVVSCCDKQAGERPTASSS